MINPTFQPNDNRQWRPIKFPVHAWEDFPAYANVYLYARMSDIEGAGHVTISVSQAALDLNLAPRTIEDYIRRCRQYEYFRHIEWLTKDLCHVYYASLAKVIATKSTIGGEVQTLLSPGDLKFKKAVIVEAAIASKQDQSFYQAKEYQKTRQETNKPAMVTVDQLFNEDRSSVNAGGNPLIKYKTNRFTFVDSQFPNFGASTITIASMLGRSARTIQRRLSNQYRQLLSNRHQQDLPVLPRTQLAKESGDAFVVAAMNDENLTPDPFIYFKSKAWVPLCNVYQTDILTFGMRRINNRARKLDLSISFYIGNRPGNLEPSTAL